MQKSSEQEIQCEIERSVSRYLGRKWSITGIAPNETESMHEGATYHGKGFDVFAKKGKNSFSLQQFNMEAIGLDYITKNTGVATPEVIEVLEVEGTALLILEAVKTKPIASDKDWEALGRGLAEIHLHNDKECGFHTDNYLGIFHQDNTREDSWAIFYGERRLRPQLKMAVDAGKLTLDLSRRVESLIRKLPELCDATQPFSLLHGDPWVGNLLFDGKQLVAIDCSTYYGNREIDLSTVELFCPASPRFFDSYNEVYPLVHGFEDRIDLWRINQWLGHVYLFGEACVDKLMMAVNRYL